MIGLHMLFLIKIYFKCLKYLENIQMYIFILYVLKVF
jgi:hypothetical protein